MESKLINGDSLEVLKDYDENSIDLLCTDPPYGYGFMGKNWDQTLPPRKIFKECLRVLKPGAFAFVMSAPRSDVQYRMVQMLDEVGFDVSFTPIYWAYATGFPKAMNISKAVDKKLGKEREVIGVSGDGANRKNSPYNTNAGWNENDLKPPGKLDLTKPNSEQAKKLDGSYAGFQPKPAVEVVIVAMKPLEKKGYLDQALDNQKGITWLDSCRIPFAGMNDEEQFDKDNVAGMMNFDGKYEKGEGKMYEGGWKKPNRDGLSKGNQPSRKKSDTYERVSAFGDSSQSETKDGRNLWGKKATKKVKITKRQPRSDHNVFKQSGFKSEDNDTAEASPMGRFPANLLVQDDVLNDGKSRKTGNLTPYMDNRDNVNTYGEYTGGRNVNHIGDEGSFSRYYDLDAWWEDRVKKLPEEVQRTFPFLIVSKASKSEKNMGLEGMEEKQRGMLHIGQLGKQQGEVWIDRKDGKGKVKVNRRYLPQKNNHPTVKPITLMSYLITLGSRKDDVVLDPFAGSGTTGIACVFSERNYILIEREKEYFKIMEARIKKAKNPAGLVENEWF
jgi:16S rRNA G966 N2-methylase RsmD